VKRIDVRLIDGIDVPLPRMVKVRQRLDRTRLEDPAGALAAGMERTLDPDAFRGRSIAITSGSRYIAGLPVVLAALIAKLRAWGARPFIVPAMGSHGGATAEGQRAVLAGYGISERTMGVPVVSSMEVTQIATLPDGLPVFCDRNALAADGIVVVNRVKPHTDFKGTHESGLLKMMAIGLGKHRGAAHLHSRGFGRMSALLPEVAGAFLRAAPVVFGVALVENPFEELQVVEVVTPGQLVERDRQLLELAKRNVARLPLPSIDVLIIDEIGKDVSGSGMDTNVTGKPASGLAAGFEAPPIQKILVRGLSKNTHGNGIGIGMADVTTTRCVSRINWGETYTNCITATVGGSAKMPMALNNDREALVVALRLCADVLPATARIVRIRNTLELSTFEISESYLAGLADQGLEVVGDPYPMRFSANGWLV
jgi:hypothetical protein